MAKNYRPPAYNYDGLSFVMLRSGLMGLSDVSEKIPFEKIGRCVGIGFAVYSYTKVIIVDYLYGQQFFNKFKSKRKSKLIIDKTRSKRKRHILFCTA